MYPASFVFKDPSSAYISLIVGNLFVGITCVVTSFLLEVFSYDEVREKAFHSSSNHMLSVDLYSVVFPCNVDARGSSHGAEKHIPHIPKLLLGSWSDGSSI